MGDTAPFDIKKYMDKGLSESEIIEIKEAFDFVDKEKSGEIDTDELKQSLSEFKSNQTLMNMIDFIDKKAEETINFDAVIDIMNEKINEIKSDEELQNMFELFQENENEEKIDLRKIAKELINENMTDDELNQMIEGDGKVDFEEFKKFMTKEISKKDS